MIGQILNDRYEILEKIGRGGMGVVFKARQLSVDRVVALKLLPEAMAQDESFAERFVREARSAAAVSHPNIVQVHDVGQDGPTRYIVMEFVEGENLADIIRREGPLPAGRALGIMKQVTEAIAAAHDCGVLHRDIKPSNILVKHADHAKIADFGLAKRSATDVTLTETGHRVGTPLYMSPEVVRGLPADRRSDLYSLGAAFYHALAGRPPFEGTDLTAVALQHVRDKAPRLSSLAPDVPDALCRVVHRLLEKDPAKRRQTAHEVLTDIQSVEESMERTQRAGSEALTRRMGATRGNSTRGTRWRAWLIGCVAVCAVVFGGLAVLVPGLLPGRATNGETTREELSPEGWRSLLDAASLDSWHVLDEGKFASSGPVALKAGSANLGAGESWTGIAWTRDFPQTDYELCLDAKRTSGETDFCDILFPVGSSHCILAVGARGGLVGLSSVDGSDVENNMTTQHVPFSSARWYQVRLRVSRSSIEAWIDGEPLVSINPSAHSIGAWDGFDAMRPLGICTWQTSAAIRGLRVRQIRSGSD